MAEVETQLIPSFETHPDRYRHWKLSIEGAVATLALDIDERNGLRPNDYLLKQNSYDLGVDLELADAVQRLRFEHPEVRVVVLSSLIPKVFCAGANIFMLASSSHGFKVNFCKFTNETRGGIEESSHQAGITWVAALNGTAAGGGYELALACDQILLVDDGASAVSLPEVPLLGVLPGTGGLTRLVDKRKVRRDIADLFCTKAEGFRARDAKKYHLVDDTFSKTKWEGALKERTLALAAKSPARSPRGITLPPLEVEVGPQGRSYRFVELSLDGGQRVARLRVKGPDKAPPATLAALEAEGAETWSFRAFRELDDALLHLRFNHPTVGLVLLETEGDGAAVVAHDQALQGFSGAWLAQEMIWHQGRVLRRLDNMARSLFAIIDRGSCFAGSLFEVALAADRSYMLADDDNAVKVEVTEASAGRFPTHNGRTRLEVRFARTPALISRALELGEAVDAEAAFEAELVTAAPDEIDWDDEIRIAVEERVSLSPDALTGMEQNLRLVGAENMDTKIFGRLTAWQNWIFQRPNAVGETGALTLYGQPERPRFDWRRT